MKQRKQFVLLHRLVRMPKLAARWTLVIGCLVAWSALAATGPVYAAESDADVVGPPVLVKDIDLTPAASNPRFVSAGDHAFIKVEGLNGPELWWSDGTTLGTTFLGTVQLDSFETRAQLNAIWYFVGYTAASGQELWRTDGTAAGTRLVKDIHPGPDHGIVTHQFTIAHNSLFFLADDGVHGLELWKSDGTAAGTLLVKEIVSEPNASLGNLANIGDTLYFTVGTRTSETLWKSDGTAAGTTLVKEFVYPTGSLTLGIQELTLFQDQLFFTFEAELWRSDGTTAGTVRLSEFVVHLDSCGSIGCGFDYIGPRFLTVVGDLLYLQADDGVNPSKLWRTDGTTAGTTAVAVVTSSATFADWPQPLGVYDQALVFRNDNQLWRTDAEDTAAMRLSPNAQQLAFATPFVVAKGLGFFLAKGAAGAELWRTDGTSAGTLLVTTPELEPYFVSSSISSVNDWVIFDANVDGAGIKLWRTDGTVAGTTVIADIPPVGYGSTFVPLNGRVIFAADDGTHGMEPWSSDGTPAGTQLLRDLRVGTASADPQEFAVVGDRLVFGAWQDTSWRLWQSDGSTAGTLPLIDPIPFGQSYDYSYYRASADLYQFQQDDNTLFFSHRDVENEQAFVELLASDAQLSALQPITALGGIGEFATLDHQLFFLETYNQRGLWKSDGTRAGTALVKSLIEDNVSLLTANGLLYFFAHEIADLTPSLWKSDGTTAGTQPVQQNLAPGDVSALVNVHDTLFFLMDGISLFKSDGTATGITLVKSIPASGFYYEPPLTLHATDDRVFFGVKSTTGQFQLWTSDGTTEGTVMLQEFQPDRAFLADLVSPDGQQVFFAADDGVHGRELWLSDGTTAGTRLVKDIAAGAAAANPSGLQPVSDILLFAATDAQSNGAVWRTNSTGTRTQKVFDLGELRNPTEFALAGNHLFFNATSPAVGNELWTIAVSTTTALTATVPAQIIGDRVGPHTIAIAVSNQGMAKVADVQLTVAFDDGVTYLGNSRNAAAARNGNTVTLNLGTIGLWYETTVELYVQLPAAATTESRYAISYTVSAAGATGLSGQTELLLAPTERYLPLIKH